MSEKDNSTKISHAEAVSLLYPKKIEVKEEEKLDAAKNEKGKNKIFSGTAKIQYKEPQRSSVKSVQKIYSLKEKQKIESIEIERLKEEEEEKKREALYESKKLPAGAPVLNNIDIPIDVGIGDFECYHYSQHKEVPTFVLGGDAERCNIVLQGSSKDDDVLKMARKIIEEHNKKLKQES